jgi:uncharacterized protein YyaL (SSP411 family)
VLQAFDFYLAPVREVAIVGPPEDVQTLARVVRGHYRPHVVLAGGAPPPTAADEHSAAVPLLEDRTPIDGQAAAYVCQHFSCQAPVTTPDALAAAL